MRLFVFALLCLASVSAAWAQPPKPASDDSWTNNLPAPDDRYSNPKSPLYNGPNGWFSGGRVLAVMGPPANLRYDYKASLNAASDGFAATESGKLHLMYMAFGTAKPADGVWQVAAKADAAKKQVLVTFTDTSNKRILNWSGGAQGGTVTVSTSGKFTYFKFRNIRLEPNGMGNKGELKQPMTIGFEGALKIDP